MSPRTFCDMRSVRWRMSEGPKAWAATLRQPLPHYGSMKASGPAQYGSGREWLARFSQVHDRVVRSVGVFSVVVSLPVVEPFLPVQEAAEAIAPADIQLDGHIPGHTSPPAVQDHVSPIRPHLLPMSPNTCYLCLRFLHSHVGGCRRKVSNDDHLGTIAHGEVACILERPLGVGGTISSQQLLCEHDCTPSTWPQLTVFQLL